MPENHNSEKRTATGKNRVRGPKRVTARYLENVALYHLERYATSRAHLGRLLMMRVERSARFHGTDRNEGSEQIAAVLDKLSRLGLLDDRSYAGTRARSLHRRGTSARGIRADLKSKGVASEFIEGALAALATDSPDPEIEAAVVYARKRRLGPYRPQAQRSDKRERDMAALGRKGFGYEVVRQIIDAEDPQILEELLERDRF